MRVALVSRFGFCFFWEVLILGEERTWLDGIGILSTDAEQHTMRTCDNNDCIERDCIMFVMLYYVVAVFAVFAVFCFYSILFYSNRYALLHY